MIVFLVLERGIVSTGAGRVLDIIERLEAFKICSACDCSSKTINLLEEQARAGLVIR